MLGGMAVLSLALCVLTEAMWVRSYRVGDAFEFQRRDGRWPVASYRGGLRADNEPQRRLEQEPLRLARLRVEGLNRRFVEINDRLGELTGCRRGASPRPRAEVEADGAEVDRLLQEAEGLREAFWQARRCLIAVMECNERSQTPPAEYSIAYPAPVAATAAPPLAWFMWVALARGRRMARLRKHLCLACGYDLRATRGRCPECGTPARNTSRGGA